MFPVPSGQVTNRVEVRKDLHTRARQKSEALYAGTKRYRETRIDGGHGYFGAGTVEHRYGKSPVPSEQGI